MFNQIFDAIEEWMRELLTGMISSNLDRMFTDVNQKIYSSSSFTEISPADAVFPAPSSTFAISSS